MASRYLMKLGDTFENFRPLGHGTQELLNLV